MKAHELLADRSKWTQGWYARLENGRHCDPLDTMAKCWCVIGSIDKCYHSKEAAMKALNAAQACSMLPLDELNDRLGYDAVMQVLREADV